jgi:phosphohistidine phosphatase SixA
MASIFEPDDPVAIRQELGPGGNVFRLVRELVAQGHKAVMLVGHEPTCSEVVGELLADGQTHKPLQKSMVVGLKVDASGQGKLRFVLDPKSMGFQSHE